MISKDEEEALNYTLAIGFLIASIQIKGELETMKEIDTSFDNPIHRLYIRKLLSEAKNIINSENIKD